MTKKKLDNPLVNQWLIELDAVIRHEVLHYLIDQRAKAAGEFFFDTQPFINLDCVLMEALCAYMDKLEEAVLDTELAELISSEGSLDGINATKRFLDEHDFLLQVIERTNFDDLSSQAQRALTNKYPIAIRTVEYLMNKSGECTLPKYIKSAKLNKCFSIENLSSPNELEHILEFHTKMIKDRWSAKNHYQKKPKLISSNKKYAFIDIELQKNNNEIRLLCNYKLHNINKLDNQHRLQVLTYCEELVKHQIDKFSTTDFSDKADMPIPPPEQMLSTRYDGYLPYIIGLYCIIHMSKYKELDGFEYEKEYDNLDAFIKEKLYSKFDFLRDEFEQWCSKNKETSNISLDALDIYISTVLVKRFKSNIKKTQSLINEYEKEYFQQ